MTISFMIVDDALFMRTMIKTWITENPDWQVVGEADNGVEAVKMYSKLNPDIVTMDITMPEMSGVEALREIMKQDPKAVVVMLSAMGQQGMVMDAVKGGAKDFLVKPVQKEKLYETMNRLVEKINS